mgnify:FL=1
MPQDIGYKYFKRKEGSADIYDFVAGDVPSDAQQVDYSAFISGIKTPRPGHSFGGFTNQYDYFKSQGGAAARSLEPGAQSGYQMINGVLTTTKSIEDTATHEVAVAAGTEKKVPVGQGFGYVPVGGPGEANLKNIGTNNTLKTDIITDPLTGKQYSRDPNVPGSTYAPYTPPGGAPAPKLTAQDYYLKPGESAADYNARIAALRAGEAAASTTTTTTPKSTSTTSSPTKTKEEIDAINAEANRLSKEELERIKNETGKVDLSKSTSLVESLVKSLETTKSQPTKSLLQEFSDQRAAMGIGGLEQDLATKDAALKKLDADYASSIEGEEGRLVSMTQVQRRQSAEGIQYNRARRDMVAERDSIANQVNMKYGVLKSMVEFAGMDIDNAQQNYQFQFNAAVSLTNLMKGIEDSAKTDADRKTDNARANLTIWTNLLKTGNVKYDDLDASTKADIRIAEINSGFPPGFTQFIHATIDEPVTTFLSAYTDAAGNRIQPVGTTNKTTGVFTIKNITLPGGTSGDTNLTEAEITRQARSDMAARLKSRTGTDGYVSPADYKAALAGWRDKGYPAEDFLPSFKSYINPSHYKDYGVSATDWIK